MVDVEQQVRQGEKKDQLESWIDGGGKQKHWYQMDVESRRNWVVELYRQWE